LYLHFQFFDFVDFFGIFKMITGKSITQVSLIGNGVAYFMLAATGMALRSGLYIFMLRQYFRGVPKELEEAAYVDGCGKIRTFIQIMLPDARPMLTSVFLFSLVWQWTDNFYSTLFFRKITLLTDNLGSIPEKLMDVRTNTPATTAYGQMMTATGMLITIAPLLILYLFAQKGFVESLSQTGIKM
jgi:multiple sugar transport system permease protein